MFSATQFMPVILAQAGDAPAAWQQVIGQFGPFILLFVVLYMLWIRPEQKRAKEHREMIKRLKAGDRIVTSGGLHGTVTACSDQTFKLRVAEKVEIEVERAAVGKVVKQSSESEGK